MIIKYVILDAPLCTLGGKSEMNCNDFVAGVESLNMLRW